MSMGAVDFSRALQHKRFLAKAMPMVEAAEAKFVDDVTGRGVMSRGEAVIVVRNQRPAVMESLNAAFEEMHR